MAETTGAIFIEGWLSLCPLASLVGDYQAKQLIDHEGNRRDDEMAQHEMLDPEAAPNAADNGGCHGLY